MPKQIKTGIAISGIYDRHQGIKPEIIECDSASEAYITLRKYLPAGRMPTYAWCLDIIKRNGYINLIKREHKNSNNKVVITYQI